MAGKVDTAEGEVVVEEVEVRGEEAVVVVEEDLVKGELEGSSKRKAEVIFQWSKRGDNYRNGG